MNPPQLAGLTVHETIGGEPEYRQKMLRFYADFFPEYAYYLPYMAYRMEQTIASDPGFIERWWLVEVGDEPVALRLFKYSFKRDCALVLGTAVKQGYRRYAVDSYERLSNYLIDQSIEQVKADALAAGRPIPTGIVSEFQLPEATMSAEEYRYHQHIIDRYREIGCIPLPVDYYEPPHIVGREQYLAPGAYETLPYNHMLLSILPIAGGGFDLNNRAMVTNCALVFLQDHYGLPEDHWVVRRALDSIDRHYGDVGHD